jgi:hypothetical protein
MCSPPTACFRQGRYLGQTGLGRSTIAGEHVAQIDVVLAEAMPVVSVSAAMESRYRNAEGECAIAQQREQSRSATIVDPVIAQWIAVHKKAC